MATVRIERTVRVTIELSNEEAIALHELLGKLSVNDMTSRGLSKEQSEAMVVLYSQLP